MYKCEICNKEISTLQSFVKHVIKIHNIQSEQYFDTYIEPNDNHICHICKINKRKFFKGKYRRTCCNKECRNTCIIKTCIEKNGVNNNFLVKNKDGKPKRDITNKNKTGYEHPLQNPIIQDKIIKHNNIMYGTDYPFQSKEYWKKHKQPMYNEISKKKMIESRFKNGNISNSKRIKYKGINFDSKWELAFYIWLEDNEMNFKREPEIIEYTYNNKIYSYVPDFKVNEKYVEIKGLQFFENKNPNNRMINPYGRRKRTNEENIFYDGLMEAKHQCMLQNNVIILTDCSKYIKYVEDTYGKTYLNKFIIHKKRKSKKVQIKK